MAMTMAYDPSIISTIPSLEQAHTATKSKDFNAFLLAFEEAVRLRKQNDRYGITLVHRHTNVEPGHRIFDFKQTLQPFPFNEDPRIFARC